MRGEFLDLNGLRIYYYATGTRGSGDPIVFLHGLGTSGLLWGDVAQRAPSGHRCVVMDLAGHGRSDRPAADALTIGAHAERLVAILDLLHIDRACLAGHEMGGGVAQRVAVGWPERVARLCLASSVSFAGWASREAQVARATLPATRHLPSGWLLTTARRQMTRGYVDRARGARMVDRFTRAFEGPDGGRALVDQLRAFRSTDLPAPADLRQLGIPATIVHGEDDPFLPTSAARALHAAIPGSELDVLPGIGHFTPDEGATRVATALHRLCAVG